MLNAILFSVGSNAEHGLPRNDADKHHAGNLLLKDDEWVKWSDREIARRCKVSHQLVGRIRKSILVLSTSMKTERTFIHHKTGEKATMKTGNIGQRYKVSPLHLLAGSPMICESRPPGVLCK